jgi:GNAT superfamily N-acetyltransferase
MKEINMITFDEILPIWSKFLWPNRVSAIETHSAIELGSLPYIYNMSYFNNTPHFFGLYVNHKLAGVNSGHLTGSSYRSRGLYVLPEFRGNHYGEELLRCTVHKAKEIGATSCWSMPRYSSRIAYSRAGLVQLSDWFGTETSDKNAYFVLNF